MVRAVTGAGVLALISQQKNARVPHPIGGLSFEPNRESREPKLHAPLRRIRWGLCGPQLLCSNSISSIVRRNDLASHFPFHNTYRCAANLDGGRLKVRQGEGERVGPS